MDVGIVSCILVSIVVSVLVISLIVGILSNVILNLFRIPELVDGEDDHKKDNKINNHVGYKHAPETLTNLVPVVEVVHLHPLQNVEKGEDCRWQHQNLKEHEPLALSGSNDDVYNGADSTQEC